MAEQIKSVGGLREAYIVDAMERSSKGQRQLEQVVREMVSAMARGASYDHQDFMFAATMGHADDYPEETRTLTEAAGLEANQMVGVTRDGHLHRVGLTGDSPLELSVSGVGDDPQSEQYNRRLQASLSFRFSARRSAEDSRYPCPDVELKTETDSELLLANSGEPNHWERGAFYRPQALLVGSVAILGHLRSIDDELGTQQLALLLDNISSVATEPSPVS